ncbi:unnamed protein product [Calypogeia fissa]
MVEKRNWEHDQPVIESYLKSFRNPCDPFGFVLFPEGTDFIEQKLIKGNNYAKELGLPGTLRHVLLPQTRGFVACVPIVHMSLDADTILYLVTFGMCSSNCECRKVLANKAFKKEFKVLSDFSGKIVILVKPSISFTISVTKVMIKKASHGRVSLAVQDVTCLQYK